MYQQKQVQFLNSFSKSHLLKYNKDEKVKKTTNKVTSSKKTTKTNQSKTTQSKPKQTKANQTKTSQNKTKQTNNKTTKNNTTKTKTNKSVQNTTKNDNVKNLETKETIILENTKEEINNNLESNKEINIENTNKEVKVEKVNVSKIEDAKFSKKKRNNKLLLVGLFLSVLGIIALILSIIANRLIDRQFLSDSSVLIMIIISIIIELFGAFIIINET